MKFVVVDFSDGSLNIYDVGDTDKEPEEILDEFGYKETNCDYMLTDDLKIRFYD